MPLSAINIFWIRSVDGHQMAKQKRPERGKLRGEHGPALPYESTQLERRTFKGKSLFDN